jgi:hypothetical protein
VIQRFNGSFKLTRRFIRRIGKNQHGMAALEFALIMPAFMIMLLGAFDVGYSLYARAVLQGAAQKAARDSGLQTGTGKSCEIDYRVIKMISSLLNVDRSDYGFITNQTMADYCAMTQAERDALLTRAKATDNSILFVRRNYTSFSEVGQMEDFTDSDNDQICDRGEPFEDINGSGVWDDRGVVGQGGARSVVLYTIAAKFERLFPLYAFIGGDRMMTVKATTVLRNQPYDVSNTDTTVTVVNCAPEDR